jgi:hypothetical protein
MDMPASVSSRRRLQFSLRALLLSAAVVTTFVVMYIHVWRVYPLVLAGFTTVIASVICMERVRKRHGYTLVGAAAGGALGVIVATAFHKIYCELLIPGMFEHEGLDLLGYTLLFAPVAVICGAIVEALTWAVVWFFAFLREVDKQNSL